jgi:hypothetical protein
MITRPGLIHARALQRSLGTIVGAVLGAVILAAVPYGPWLLVPMAVLAAGMPYGRLRNFGLVATFMTPLVVLLIDLLAPIGWRLAEERLVDTRDRAARRVRAVAEQLALAPAGAVRRHAARHLPVHGGGAHHGAGSGGPRPPVAAASQGLPRSR